MTVSAIEVPTLQVFGLTTTDGTAMGETAVCAEHFAGGKDFAMDMATPDPGESIDWKTGFIDVSENEAMVCFLCSRNGYGEDFWG